MKLCVKWKKASPTKFPETSCHSTSAGVFITWARSPARSPMKTSWIIFLVSFVLESRRQLPGQAQNEELFPFAKARQNLIRVRSLNFIKQYFLYFVSATFIKAKILYQDHSKRNICTKFITAIM